MPRYLVSLLTIACFLGHPAAAQDASPDRPVAGTAGSPTRLVLAQRSYAHALRAGDALMLVAAIRLARSVTLRPATGWEKTSTGPDVGAVPLQGPDPGSDIALTIARNLAAEDPDLQDLVYDLGAQVPHATHLTAVVAEARLGAGDSDTWRLPLFGSVPAELAVIPLEGGPLAVTIVDEGAISVCTRTPTEEPSLCRFTPLLNGFFTVTVRNVGPTPAGYRLVGN
jgi:hypothetical protein